VLLSLLLVVLILASPLALVSREVLLLNVVLLVVALLTLPRLPLLTPRPLLTLLFLLLDSPVLLGLIVLLVPRNVRPLLSSLLDISRYLLSLFLLVLSRLDPSGLLTPLVLAPPLLGHRLLLVPVLLTLLMTLLLAGTGLLSTLPLVFLSLFLVVLNGASTALWRVLLAVDLFVLLSPPLLSVRVVSHGLIVSESIPDTSPGLSSLFSRRVEPTWACM